MSVIEYPNVKVDKQNIEIIKEPSQGSVTKISAHKNGDISFSFDIDNTLFKIVGNDIIIYSAEDKWEIVFHKMLKLALSDKSPTITLLTKHSMTFKSLLFNFDTLKEVNLQLDINSTKDLTLEYPNNIHISSINEILNKDYTKTKTFDIVQSDINLDSINHNNTIDSVNNHMSLEESCIIKKAKNNSCKVKVMQNYDFRDDEFKELCELHIQKNVTATFWAFNFYKRKIIINGNGNINFILTKEDVEIDFSNISYRGNGNIILTVPYTINISGQNLYPVNSLDIAAKVITGIDSNQLKHIETMDGDGNIKIFPATNKTVKENKFSIKKLFGFKG